MPGVYLGVGALMLPALYIALSLAGHPAPLGKLYGDLARSMRDTGLALLGLAPALLFLTATRTSIDFPQALAYGTAALGAVVGLRVLQERLFAPGKSTSVLSRTAFTCWSAVALGIGVCLVISALLS